MWSQLDRRLHTETDLDVWRLRRVRGKLYVHSCRFGEVPLANAEGWFREGVLQGAY